MPSGDAARPKVLLLSLPWGALGEPSLGLAILKAELQRHGIPCRVQHLHLFLLKYLKAGTYQGTADSWAVTDFVFTKELQGEAVAPEQIRAIERLVRDTFDRIDLTARASYDPVPHVDQALKTRNEVVPAFLDDCMQRVARDDYTMVGFTCMYDQTFASLALARRIKEAFPEKLLVLGGYSLERPVGPEILAAFPFVDVIAFGDGEPKVAALARASVDRKRLRTIPDIMYRGEDGRVRSNPKDARRYDLDASPVPDYDDWFRDLDELAGDHDVHIHTQVLPVESSRGCWWGQRHHCVFCGIDDETMVYRSKSSERVKMILSELEKRYGVTRFRFSDYILPRAFYKTLLPDLAAMGAPYRLHWEMKSNIKAQDADLMKAAGIHRVQAGIESFSTPVLKRIKKGVTGIRNVLTLKLMAARGIELYYNVLYGFPGEEAEDYAAVCRNVPLLYHLPPPETYVPVLLTRYAPLHRDSRRFGLPPLAANRRYEIMLSREYCEQIGFDTDRYCYVFERPYRFDQDVSDQYDILVYQLFHWRNLAMRRPVQLSYERAVDGACFFDTRYDERGTQHAFGEAHAEVYEFLHETIVTRRKLLAHFDGRLDPSTIDSVVDDLDRARLLYREDSKLLGLALPARE
ncbi:MAG: RiPP maturation radical SAM C-methyltransferase [Myxococcota bacterium]|nr:RiPP maturation radical SAM C-methyltransferase [Myxococcota bacterium]